VSTGPRHPAHVEQVVEVDSARSPRLKELLLPDVTSEVLVPSAEKQHQVRSALERMAPEDLGELEDLEAAVAPVERGRKDRRQQPRPFIRKRHLRPTPPCAATYLRRESDVLVAVVAHGVRNEVDPGSAQNEVQEPRVEAAAKVRPHPRPASQVGAVRLDRHLDRPVYRRLEP
jgi:hypothetical protein